MRQSIPRWRLSSSEPKWLLQRPKMSTKRSRASPRRKQDGQPRMTPRTRRRPACPRKNEQRALIQKRGRLVTSKWLTGPFGQVNCPSRCIRARAKCEPQASPTAMSCLRCRSKKLLCIVNNQMKCKTKMEAEVSLGTSQVEELLGSILAVLKSMESTQLTYYWASLKSLDDIADPMYCLGDH